MYDLLYQNNNGTMKVRLPQTLYQEMQKICIASYPNETGGILIGTYSDDLVQANICKVTGPPPRSKHWSNRFLRGTCGIVNMLESEWQWGNYYLGEWHYHPNFSPMPSSTDINQMLSLSKHVKLHCPEPILIIIGGNHCGWKLYVSVVKDTETKLSEINERPE